LPQCDYIATISTPLILAIVNKGMHELRRVVNAVIKQYGKPDVVRIEMARDLEMYKNDLLLNLRISTA
jgi:CRISPR/Cas system Type II protein with McrA/HNH and RuvC-like nuclease domain